MPPFQAYPNDENYPVPSFDQPFVAPLSDPDEGATFSVAFNPEWLPYVLGALDQLMLMSTWAGTNDEIIDAVSRAAILKMIFAEGETLPAPYWDDPEGDDAGNDDDNIAFPFYEDVANWVITGFVAYAAGIGAAMQYYTLSQQFRVAVRKHNLGGIIKVFMEASEVAEIDTYSASPDLAFVDVISTGSMLRIEVVGKNPLVEGEPITQIIRKRLWEGEITGGQWRYNEDCDCFQSYDPSTDTWYDNPNADPRHSIVYLLPPVEADDPRCQAAINIRDKIERMIDAYLTAVTIVQAVAAIGAIISVFAPPAGWFAALLIAVAEALFEIGNAAIFLAFTESAYDEFQCIVYDEISTNGQVTAEQKDAIYTRVEAEMSPVQFAVLSLLINLLGETGMSNAGATQNAEGDCDVCGWTKCWLGGDGLGAWETPWVTPIDPRSAGVYNAGTDTIDGTEINETSVWANFVLNEALDVTGLVIEFDYDNPSPYGDQGFIWFVNGEEYQTGLMPSGTGSSSYSWEGDGTGITQLGFLFASGGSVSITRIKLAGIGTPPETGVDCE